MRRQTGAYHLPENVVDLMARTAASYGGRTVIDPWLHDPFLLRSLGFAENRVGLVPNESLFRQLADEEPQLTLQYSDVFTDRVSGEFDVVLWGPPWGQKVEWKGRRHRVEAFVLDRAVELTAAGGVIVCLLPPNVLSAPLWRPTRQRIVSDFALELTVEFPRHSLPDTFVQPVMIVVRKAASKSTVFLARYTSNHESLLTDLDCQTGEFHVPTSQIRDRWDRNFHDPPFGAIDDRLQGCPVRTIGDFGDVFAGAPRLRELIGDDGDHVVVTGDVLNRGGLGAFDNAQYAVPSEDPSIQRCVLRPGDILLSSIRPSIYVYRESDPPAIAGSSVLVIRSDENEYLASYLLTEDGRWLFETQVDRKATSLAGVQRISAAQLREFQIPIVPLSQPSLLFQENLAHASKADVEKHSKELLEARREILQLRHRLEQEEARRVGAQERASQAELQLRQHTVTQHFIEGKLAAVNERLAQIQASVDRLGEVLASVANEFTAAKMSDRHIEEKIARMRGSLEHLATQLLEAGDTHETYVEVVQVWLDDWELLDANSQLYLATGERLFDLCSEGSAADLSPFVLQYCRALENELLLRVFHAYHDDFNSRIADRAAFVAEDLQRTNVAKFAKSIRNDNRRHSMGDMVWVLDLARPGGSTLASSPLLGDFSRFAATTFGGELMSIEMTKQLKFIADQFRNRAAHPDIIGQSDARDCRDAVRQALIDLIGCYP